jgi:hypothetical protein
MARKRKYATLAEIRAGKYDPRMFERRHVAFLDVLGFREFVRRAETSVTARRKLWQIMNRLARLVNQLTSSERGLTKLQEDSYEQTQRKWARQGAHRTGTLLVSDSIILTIKADRLGLHLLVRQCAHIINTLLESGFLTRGAITTGPIWYQDQPYVNVVGSAFIEAYLMEKGAAKHPRVVLADQVASKYLPLSGMRVETGVNLLDVSFVDEEAVLQDSDGLYFVNSLRPEYFGRRAILTGRDSTDDFRMFLKHVSGQIRRNLRTWPDDSSAHSHWQWMDRYVQKRESLGQSKLT